MPYLETRIRHLRQDARHKGGEYLNRYMTVALQPPPDDKLKTRGKYKFQPPPSQFDPVIRQIIRIIRELGHQDIGFASANIRVHNSNETAPFWPINPYYPYYDAKLYTFLMDDIPYREEFPITAQVCVHTLTGRLHKDAVYIKIGKDWLEMRKWLISKRHAQEDLVGKIGFGAQRKWWKLNGKRFRLLDLPSEIRNMVYGYALGKEVHPMPLYEPDNGEIVSMVLGAGYSRKLISSDVYPEDSVPEVREDVSPNLALLQTCWQIYEEALPAAWNSSLKCFNNEQIFLTIVDLSVDSMTQFNCLGKIQLNFKLKSWFRFFGVTVNPRISIDESSSSGLYISKTGLPNLRYLEMRFRSPHDGSDGNPWSRGWEDNGALDCCQVNAVDMVCTFAFPFVAWIPTVKLVGYVKTASKKKWENIFDSERRRLSHGHNQEAAMQALLQAPADLLPPPCSCSQSCATNRRNRWHEEVRYIIFGAACSVLAFDDSDDFKYDELEDHVPSKFALWQAAYEARWRSEQSRLQQEKEGEEN
ncbi:hypothetical protein HBI26_061390 [Parastagonospora nodorum]|nr:hypothetical protein HBH52_055540 [Parastagonospora nodorum]KAH5077459.1 hypothetical protein HBH95_110320 [Parastagonospora nodorum]KAH5161295.1 hypothetical protein HBH69_029670 [Parastagonospora nodorum]KAH5167686.1 hypothetical protein HBI73_018420 [Parastagonospora nodorum]KAH5465852.1 hypothetical protein HBI28_221070 [Parastagonospora nodorum]